MRPVYTAGGGAFGTAMLIDQAAPWLVGGWECLRVCFAQEALAQKLDANEAARLFQSLPADLRVCPCFYDVLTKFWRYEFGTPYHLRAGALLGPHVWPLVRHLVAVARLADRWLTPRQRERYWARLCDRDRHEQVLFEFVPILRLPDNAIPHYEWKTGAGGRDVDWRIEAGRAPDVLIDVKRRIYDLLALNERLNHGERLGPGVAPQPEHATDDLVRSVEEKFLPRRPEQQLQGAWIASALKQERSELKATWTRLDPARVHFIVLGGWDAGIDVIAHDRRIQEAVLRTLGQRRCDDGWRFARTDGQRRPR
jgi:hypothetical protein